MVEGIALNETAFYLSDQVMAVVLAAALALGAAVYLCVARPRRLFGHNRAGGSSGRKLGLFLGILCATGVLVFPVLLCIQEGNALAAIPLLGVRLMQAVVVDNGYVDYIAGLPTGALATLYYCLIGLAYVALPLLAALNVYDLVMQNLSRAGAAWAVHVASRGKNVYLFSDFNRNTYGLVRDVLAHDERAFVVFAAMSKLERDTWSTEIAKLDSDRVKCFEADYPDMAARLCASFKFACLRCFAFSDDCDRDVSETCRTLAKLRGTNRAGAAGGGDAGVGASSPFAGLRGRERIARVQLYVTCDSADDQVLLDAANGRGEAAGAALALRLSVLNEATMAAYALFDEAPPFRVLDAGEPGPLGLRPAHPTDLNMLVVGSGRYAEEALKAALWYGQMYQVELKVDVVAPDAQAMRDRVLLRYPALASDGRCAVQFTQLNVQSPAFHSECLERFGQGARTYAIVAIEDDALSYEVALHMRLFFLDRQTDRSADVANRPFIACLMRDGAMSELVATRFDEDAPGYGLFPFGCGSRLFSYGGIVDSRLERVGQRAVDLYDALWSGLEGRPFDSAEVDVSRLKEAVLDTLEGAASAQSACGADAPPDGGIGCLPQVRHYSNLALALHARYKAWALCLPDGAPLAKDEATAFVRALPDEAVCALGEVEHNRWTMFYQTQGYTHLSASDQERYSRLLPGKNNRRKIEPFKKHAFVCPNGSIWENYLHAVGGFSYEQRADVVPGGTSVRVRIVARGLAEKLGAGPGMEMQLLDSNYRVIEEWCLEGAEHLTAPLPDGVYVLHPALALPGRECANDLAFEVREGRARVEGVEVGAVEFDSTGKPLVNPIIYDEAFSLATPFLADEQRR